MLREKSDKNFTEFRPHMDRSIPVGNRICTKRLQDRRYAAHRNQLEKAKSSIDNGLPVSVTFPHMRANRKREQLTEDRFIEIDRGNRCLLDKIKDIDTRVAGSLGKAFPQPNVTSLNKGSRRLELERITRENGGIVSRIETVPPIYDHVRLEHEFQQSRVYMKNKCALPIVLETSQVVGNSQVAPTQDCRPSSSREPSPSIAPDCSIIAQDGRRIGDRFYLVEISPGSEGGLLIRARCSESVDPLVLELSQSDHEELVTKGWDYERIISNLQVSVFAGKMVLENFVFSA